MLVPSILPVIALIFPSSSPLPGEQGLPLLELTEDDTRISESTRIRIPANLVIRDANGNGVIHVVGEGVQLVFEAGSVLRGAPDSDAPDSFSGTGLRVQNQRNVAVEGLTVRGFHTGIFASRADGLLVSQADVSDNFAERLASTPETCDDGADWLGCHDNDGGEWRARYGAGICVEDSRGVVIRASRARRTQNGLLLSRVNESAIYDNDFSFLSGWGLGLWRSSDNVVSNNSFDFCIRGYSHGKYNRGQDSAGILIFEQCSGNVFAHNSATHGGDGVFGFAGSEALGQRDKLPEGFDSRGKGCNGNLFLGNDFSYAAAHGLEMTFSFENQVLSNRFVGNGICGIWGGYSQSMLIAENHFEANGDAGYGKERGGVNIEHSVHNRIVGNQFKGNACGVHLWWDEDTGLFATPWAQANETGCIGNEVTGNQFEEDQVALELRACQPVLVANNEMKNVATEFAMEDGAAVSGPTPERAVLPRVNRTIPGTRAAIGARAHLAGRENIVMGTWGPWDHEAPLIQPLDRTSGVHRFALHNIPLEAPLVLKGEGVRMDVHAGSPRSVHLSSERDGLFPYELRVGTIVVSGVLQRLSWQVAAFAFDEDPRTAQEAWKVAALAATAMTRESLDLAYASGGPAALGFPGVADDRRDHFGTLATAKVTLPAGTYEIRTMSDDGLRVFVDGEAVIDNWTWHAPTPENKEFKLREEREVTLRVEHFELDGYAILQVSLRPVR